MSPDELETKLKVNYMKRNQLTLVLILALGAPLTGLAAAPAAETGTTAVDSAAATGGLAETRAAMHGQGMKHKGHCGHKKGKGGGKHGKHGGGHDKKQDEVLQRLDMIEARIAKIESMLESLMRRR